MANSYNSNPIIIVSAMTSGWKANQTLYSSAKTAVLGRITKVLWSDIVAAGQQFTIIDPIDSTNLLQGQAGSVLADQYYEFEYAVSWRDFEVNRLDGGTLSIWYRA